MREIKFRAWDKTGKNWFGWRELTLRNGICYFHPARMEDLEIVQYTGLKDKNDKEIYEGDILKTTSELMTRFGERGTGKYQTNYFSIEYDNTRAQFKERDIESNYLKPLGLSQDIISKYSEVIGNIYENPELLEGQNETLS